MTPRQNDSLERSMGRIEGQLKGMAETLAEVRERLENAEEWRATVRHRLDAMEAHGKQMTAVAEAFAALQRSIREGTIMAKAYSRGVILGVGLAAGAGGATIATGLKWLYATLTGSGL